MLVGLAGFEPATPRNMRYASPAKTATRGAESGLRSPRFRPFRRCLGDTGSQYGPAGPHTRHRSICASWMLGSESPCATTPPSPIATKQSPGRTLAGDLEFRLRVGPDR